MVCIHFCYFVVRKPGILQSFVLFFNDRVKSISFGLLNFVKNEFESWLYVLDLNINHLALWLNPLLQR